MVGCCPAFRFTVQVVATPLHVGTRVGCCPALRVTLQGGSSPRLVSGARSPVFYLENSVNRLSLDLYGLVSMNNHRETDSPDFKVLGNMQLSYGAPPEVKALAAFRNFLEEVLLGGLICPDTEIYQRVVAWIQQVSLLNLEKDLLTTSPRRGSKYRRFLRDSVGKLVGWVGSLRDMPPEDSCNNIIRTYCPLHQMEHLVTTEEVFAGKLVEFLGFLRCVSERTESPYLEIAGEEDGIYSYQVMVEEERVWRDRKRLLSGDSV